MPPQRTIPVMKAANMKTERTHEENQERAYIAASRRSDRSLEARVESARRASEIHKRRTGRALRVTEQDVLNEEMYEEEEDDLPLPYRQLTQHLTTGSAEFNRRLAAYLTNHVAVRSALNQIIQDSHSMSANGGGGGENFVGNSFGQQFTPSVYSTPLQGPISYTDNVTPATQQQRQQQQQFFQNQQQSAGGTQFQMGPLGLSTINQGQNRAAPYARRTPAEQQQARSMSMSEELRGPDLKMNTSITTPPTPTSTTPSYDLNSRRMSMPTQLGLKSTMVPSSRQATGIHTPSLSPIVNVQKQPASLSVANIKDMNLKQMESAVSKIPSHDSQKTQQNNAAKKPLFNMALPQNAQDLMYGSGLDMSDSLNQSMMTSINPQSMTFGDKKLMTKDAPHGLQNAAAHFGPKPSTKIPLSLNLNLNTDSFNTASEQPMLSSYIDSNFDTMMQNGSSSSLPTVMRFDSTDYGNHGNIDDLWNDFLSDSYNEEAPGGSQEVKQESS